MLDEQGLPINDAQVSTRVNLPGKTVSNEGAHTDSTGQFQVDHLPMGTFDVFASKSQDGYVGFGLIPGLQTVTLTPQAPLATVILKLGPREAILAPSAKDKVTGKPVCNLVYSWHVVSTDTLGIAGGGGFSHRSLLLAHFADVRFDA